jgi:hypothetical protein
MVTRVKLCLGTAIAAAFLSATAAGAATVDLGYERFGRSDLSAARDAMSGFLGSHTVRKLHQETFEGYKAWNGRSGTTDPKNSKVGSFDAFGAAGSGDSVVGKGSRLQVRNDSTMKWGRYSTDATLGGNWLDSNDNRGMKWKIDGVGKFNAVSFFVLDAADVGGKFSIKVGKTLYSDIAGGAKLANGNIHFVHVLLSEAVDHLTVRLLHDRTNDGFGIDGATVARVGPVPLPPAAALMLPGLLALFGLRRRRAAA